MEKCTTFIKKVQKSRFVKVRDKQVKTFDRFMGKDRDRELITQPLANTAQPLTQNNSNKWVINTSNIPCPRPESLLSKGPNYAVAPKNTPPGIHYLYRISMPKVRPSRSRGT